MLRAKSLNKFVLTSTLLVFVTFIFLISILLYISLNEYIKKEAVKKAESAAILTVSYIEKQFERALLNARFLSFLLETIKDQSNPSRDDVVKILKNIVENNSEFLGAWVVFEPDAFDARDYEYTNSPGAIKTEDLYHTTTVLMGIIWKAVTDTMTLLHFQTGTAFLKRQDLKQL